MRKILFLTSNNLATNPRLVKELVLANKDFECTLFSFQLFNWSDSLDAERRTSFPDVKFKVLSAGRRPFFSWLFSSLIERSAQFLYPFFKRNLFINAIAHSKRCFLLWLALKKHKKHYDLIIAHNLASLYPAYSFAKTHKIPFAFDIEDYHPGEAIGTDIKNEISRRQYLMTKVLPEALYVSYASPLIGKAFLDLFKNNFKPKHFLVNNSFFSEDFVVNSEYKSHKLSFVWFSQNISSGRGLELIVPVLFKYRDKVHLTVIGNLNAVFYSNFLKEYNEVLTIEEPLSQKELHAALSAFDVGLAIELSAADLNRELCLTNKIFAYSQAGLFVLATNTEAQKLFVNQLPVLGEVVSQSAEEFEDAIRSILTRSEEIRKGRECRYKAAKELAWELESEKLLTAWNL